MQILLSESIQQPIVKLRIGLLFIHYIFFYVKENNNIETKKNMLVWLILIGQKS